MKVTLTILLALLPFDGVRFCRSSEGAKNYCAVTCISSYLQSLLVRIWVHTTRNYRFILALSLLAFMVVSINAQTSQTYTLVGTHTFTPPSGVTSINVQAWGGGGSGGYNTSGRARGGGGGGAYTSGTISCIPGVPITIIVGAGGIYNDNNTATDDGGKSSAGVIVANAGSRGVVGNNVATNGGPGGISSTNPGGVTSFLSFPGGNGGNGYVNGDHGGGGGGGESASATGAGNSGGPGTYNGNGGAGGSGNAGGGDGGRGSDNNGFSNSVNGTSPGGGAGGRGDDNGSNRNGGDGQVILSWSVPIGYCIGNALSVISNQNVTSSASAIGAPDGDGAHLNETNDQITLELTSGNPLTAAGTVDVVWQRVSSYNTIIRVEVSENGTAWVIEGNYTNINPRVSWITQSISLPVNTRYIRFTSNNGYDLDIDAVTFSTPCAASCITPAIFNVTGGGVYCSGSGLPINLSGSETGVAYQLYLGSNPQGSPVAGTGAAINFGNQVAAGNYTVIATRITGGCVSTMNGIAIISFSIPSQPSTISGPIISCIGTSQTYSVTNIPGFTYAWTFPSGWTQTGGGTGNSVVVTAGSSAGNITVTPSNACGTGTSRILTVSTTTTSPAQPGVITGQVSPCTSATTLSYSVPNVAGVTYAWAFPADWTISAGQGTNLATVTAGVIAGNVMVTASNGCGSGPVQTLALVPVSVPLQPSSITGDTTPCQGSSEIYSTVNQPGTTYNWTFPAGWTQTGGGTSNSVSVMVGAGSGNVTVTPSNGTCFGASRNLAVITSPAAPSTPGTISGTAIQCPLVSGQTYSISAVPNATSYTWSVPAGWTITSGIGTTSIIATAGTVGQNGTISVTAGNSCGTSAAQTLPVSVSPIPVPDISANYCAGGGYIRLTANGGGAGATYLWNTDETTSEILVNIAGQYSVLVTNSAGCSASALYNVSTELVVNGDFSAGNTGFTHSTYIYNTDNTGVTNELNPEGHYGVGADPQAYHSNFWGRDHTNGTGNFMIVNGFPGAPQPVIWATNVPVVPGTSYYFSAWALSLNTAGNYAVLQFRVNGSLVGTTAPLPARPQNNNPPFNWIQFYGTWTAPAGVFSVPIEIVDSQTAAAGNDFGLDDISFATLAPLPAVIAPSSNATSFCIGQTLNLFANLKGGKAPFTFSWTGPDGFSSSLENPSITNVTAAKSGIYKLTITDGYGCAPVTASASPITVIAPPTCSVTGPATLCPSSIANIYTAPAGMTSYAWSITGNGSISGAANGQSVNVTAGPTNNSQFTLSLAMTNATGCSSNCQQVFQVADNVPPTFTLPLLSAGYCVEYVSQALYNPGQENTALDITYLRPDYYLVAAGSTLLNLGSLADNCALAVNPVAWTIDFGNNGSIELSGTGQISTYGSELQFPLGTNRISYTVTDKAGNVTIQSVDVVVTPRPIISNNF